MELPGKNLTPEQQAAAFNELARRANKPDRWEVREGAVVKVKPVSVHPGTIIHKDATPIFKEKGSTEQVGWVYTLDGYFDYTAEWTDDCITVYVQWGDDQQGDMYSFEHWDEVRRDLNRIITTQQIVNQRSESST